MTLTWHKHTADVEFTVDTNTCENMVKESILAVTQAMVNLDTVDKVMQQYFEIDNTNIERALFDVLSEIIYLKDAQQFIVADCDVVITDKIQVTLHGTLLSDRIEQNVDVKAVTMHKFEVKHETGWHARVVLDI